MKIFVIIGLFSNMVEGRYGLYVLLDNGVNFYFKCKLCFLWIFFEILVVVKVINNILWCENLFVVIGN